MQSGQVGAVELRALVYLSVKHGLVLVQWSFKTILALLQIWHPMLWSGFFFIFIWRTEASLSLEALS